MKNWKNTLVPMLFAVASVLFLFPVVKQLIQGEPLDAAFSVLASACFVLAVVFAARRKPSGSGPANAAQGPLPGKP